MIVKFIGEVVPDQLQSASAVEVFNKQIYIAGDNINYIYLYSEKYSLLDKIKLFADADFNTQPKPVKKDWEAMSILNIPGRVPKLLLAGSGSKKVKRDFAIVMSLKSRKINNIEHWPRYYNVVRKKLVDNEELNIEGIAQVKDSLVLLNRGNLTGGNVIFVSPAKAAVAFSDVVHRIESAPLDIAGTKAGFTGAFYMEETDTLFYTAAAELTTNAYLDGKVVGSAIGYFSNVSNRLTEANWVPDKQVAFHDILEGKVESLTLLRKLDNKYVFLVVTDNDGAPGSMYELLIEL
ncbi:MAG: hypothetical protein M0D57_16520 [Sphingobacteriales bacterium JAD_PAG50586_3]|nr:MAG: hypothetical protein M0D57_16520 [Sphingobacteriales bacterium JAD_PAG50586_3]